MRLLAPPLAAAAVFVAVFLRYWIHWLLLPRCRKHLQKPMVWMLPDRGCRLCWESDFIQWNKEKETS